MLDNLFPVTSTERYNSYLDLINYIIEKGVKLGSDFNKQKQDVDSLKNKFLDIV